MRIKIAAILILTTVLSASAQRPSAPVKADSILILKKDHLLELLSAGKVIRSYKVALGSGGLAPKDRQGDGRTPEGHYVIDNRNAASHYHKALHVSYPNPDDRRRAARLGAAHQIYDWTLGCIAVTDQEIDEIWPLVPTGTPVEIRP